MLKDLFVNATILITFILITSQIFKNGTLNLSISYKYKFLFGLTQGILGIILMLFTIHVNPKAIMDLRHIPILLAALYGGGFASIISGITIALFRISYFGVSTPSIIASVNMFNIAIACAIISRMNLKGFRKWMYMNIISSLFITSTFLLIIKNSIILRNTLIYFWIASIIIGALAYYISNYMNISIKLLDRLKHESTIDFLTGLNNVRQYDNALNTSFLSVRNRDEHLSILIIDIDFFKQINDTYGHLAGDAVLKQLGIILSTSSRSFDVVSRIGGEEFSVILPDCPTNQSMEVAERLRSAVELNEFILPDETKINIHVSIGSATYPDNVNNLENLVHEADTALYAAKHSGRNKVCHPE
ncbi:GGDEF domain-containing protein [Clostridium estertheticum]|uniref:GGDEF domain-containing protein n=1 Tax=Clostridium estertheticum TaxID=238834 RepID=UPI001CF50F7F|nr:diguanylate cyclase [Clostridium estertheticum]MCB2355097.1 diguanylate cyclase [Clostridium estertheticum]WAG42039.1 diguanylate cyclase [Clostridium estertheticum]